MGADNAPKAGCVVGFEEVSELVKHEQSITNIGAERRNSHPRDFLAAIQDRLLFNYCDCCQLSLSIVNAVFTRLACSRIIIFWVICLFRVIDVILFSVF
jgi:hypothetical protein